MMKLSFLLPREPLENSSRESELKSTTSTLWPCS